MWRNIGAVLAGMFVGSAANMAVILTSQAMFPPPAGADLQDPAQFQTYLDTLPVTAFLMAILAHMLQAGLGGWLAARLGASRPMLLAMIVAGLTLLGGVANLLMLSAPTWMWIEVPLYLVVGWGVGTLEVRRRAGA